MTGSRRDTNLLGPGDGSIFEITRRYKLRSDKPKTAFRDRTPEAHPSILISEISALIIESTELMASVV